MEPAPIETFTYEQDLIGKIRFDPDPPNPRDDDNLGTMVCWHSRYRLGDDKPELAAYEFFQYLAEEADPTVAERIDYWCDGPGWRYLLTRYPEASPDNLYSRQALAAADKRKEEIITQAIDQHFIILPLFLYDHSGLAIRTVPFSCPWDSGQVGWIFVPIAQVKKEFGWHRLTKERRRKIEQYLRDEVEQYDQYLSGQVFEFVLEDEDEQFLDACGGFYDEQYCRLMLQEAVENLLHHRASNREPQPH